MSQLPANLVDDAALAIAEGINTGALAFSDGFQFQDVFKFIPTFLSVQVIVEKKDELLAQLKDYDLIERGNTIEKIKEKLDWSDQDAEELTGIVYDVIFAVVRGIVYLSNRGAASDEA